MTCTWCDKPASRGDLCWMHLKRRQRSASGKSAPAMSEPVREYGRTASELLRHAANMYREASSEDDSAFDRADAVLRVYAARAVRKRANNVHKPPKTPRRG